MTRRPLVVACLVLAGCSSGPPRVGDRGPVASNPREEEAYQDLLNRYSSIHQIYEGLDSRAMLGATYESWPFRLARTDRMAEFLALPEVERQKKLAEQRAEAALWYEFTFGAHVNDLKFNDFDKKDSIWRIALVTKSGDVAPAEVYRVGRTNLQMRAYYPYLDEFWVAYRVRFPKSKPDGSPTVGDDEPTLTLRVASTLGKADLVVPSR